MGFVTLKKPIYRAAVIPYHIDEYGAVLMMFQRPSDPTYSGDVFQLAKGQVDAGETFEQTALREGGEELGLRPSNIKSTFRLGTFLKYTDVFCCEVINRDDFGDHDHETAERKWMTVEEFNMTGRDIHHEVVNAACQEILMRIISGLVEDDEQS